MRSPTVMRLEAKRLERRWRSSTGDGPAGLAAASGFSAADANVGYSAPCRPKFLPPGLSAGGRGLSCAAHRPAGVQRAPARDGKPQIYLRGLSGAGNLTPGELLRKCNPLGDRGYAGPGKCFECDMARARPNRSAIGVARSIGVSQGCSRSLAGTGPPKQVRALPVASVCCAEAAGADRTRAGLVPGDPAGRPGCDRLLRAIASGAYRGGAGAAWDRPARRAGGIGGGGAASADAGALPLLRCRAVRVVDRQCFRRRGPP